MAKTIEAQTRYWWQDATERRLSHSHLRVEVDHRGKYQRLTDLATGEVTYRRAKARI